MKNTVKIKKISSIRYKVYLGSSYIATVTLRETGLSWGGHEWVAYDEENENTIITYGRYKEDCIEDLLSKQ